MFAASRFSKDSLLSDTSQIDNLLTFEKSGNANNALDDILKYSRFVKSENSTGISFS